MYDVVATLHVFGDSAEPDLAALQEANVSKELRLNESIPCFVEADFAAPVVSVLEPCPIASVANAETCAGTELPLGGTCVPKCGSGKVPSTDLLTCTERYL